MIQTDKECIKKIVSIWQALQQQIKDHHITAENLMDDEFFQWAVTTPLYNIGEQVYHISPETKSAYPDIPWTVVSGLRHRLVHDYDGINWTIIVDVIFNEMEEFINSIQSIL